MRFRERAVGLFFYALATSAACGQMEEPLRRNLAPAFCDPLPWAHSFHVTPSPFSGHYSFRPSNYKQAFARAEYLDSRREVLAPGFWRLPRTNSTATAPPAVRPAAAFPTQRAARPFVQRASASSAVPTTPNGKPVSLPSSQSGTYATPLFPLPYR